ncbi:hypothetical protein [Asanoa sp. NPDC050611]|uniref:hypothetical protein n=1 Tax=Asanoa sp. NPDC050611 TaxID=3157098 RepID=UPI0033DDDB88
MGVLYDYFRAPDAAAVATLTDETDGGPGAWGGVEPVVDAKGIDLAVNLGKVVAFARWIRL